MSQANYLCDVIVVVQRVDNKRLTPEESKMVEVLQAAAQDAVVKKMAEYDQQELAKLGKVKVDY